MEPTDVFVHNQRMLLDALRGSVTSTNNKGEAPRLTLRLERILKNRKDNTTVPYDGEGGLEAVLEAVAEAWQDSMRVVEEDHLVGIRGVATLATGDVVPLQTELDAGGQMVCAAGPSDSVADLLEAIESFDRLVHVATHGMGYEYELLSEGYNPMVDSPLDVSLVPNTRWTLLTAYLSQTGRYARDVLRCTCSTTVRIAHDGERDALDVYKAAVALSPLFTFLTDNVRSFRGSGARRCPRMVRAKLWDEVDPARCGVIPGTFSSGFSFDRYVTWLKGLPGILFVDDAGNTTSLGKATVREFLRDRTISRAEAAGMLNTAFPLARLLNGELEVSQADALRPKMAAGYLAFVKGLLYNDLAVDQILSLVGDVSDEDVAKASLELRESGWNATIYGKDTGGLVDELLRICRSYLSDPAELAILNNIAELWEVRMVPRDAFVRQEVKQVRGW